MRELLVRRALPAGRCRHVDRDQDFAVGQRGRHDAGEELIRRNGALPSRAGRDHAGVERDQDGRQIGGRIGVRDVAADRAAIPDRRIADDRRRLRQRGSRVAQIRRCRQVGVRRERADADPIALSRDAAQLGDPADVDDGRRRRQPQLQQRQQAVAAGQELRAGVRGEQLMRVGDRARRGSSRSSMRT